jgi:hypothetical protein
VFEENLFHFARRHRIAAGQAPPFGLSSGAVRAQQIGTGKAR